MSKGECWNAVMGWWGHCIAWNLKMAAKRGKWGTLLLLPHLPYHDQLRARKEFSLLGKGKQKTLISPNCHYRQLQYLLQENLIVLTSPWVQFGKVPEIHVSALLQIRSKSCVFPNKLLQPGAILNLEPLLKCTMFWGLVNTVPLQSCRSTVISPSPHWWLKCCDPDCSDLGPRKGQP